MACVSVGLDPVSDLTNRRCDVTEVMSMEARIARLRTMADRTLVLTLWLLLLLTFLLAA